MLIRDVRRSAAAPSPSRRRAGPQPQRRDRCAQAAIVAIQRKTGDRAVHITPPDPGYKAVPQKQTDGDLKQFTSENVAVRSVDAAGEAHSIFHSKAVGMDSSTHGWDVISGVPLRPITVRGNRIRASQQSLSSRLMWCEGCGSQSTSSQRECVELISWAVVGPVIMRLHGPNERSTGSCSMAVG